ncbi:hypothetical protein NL676_032784 [Syzygium grande]|nr:hypothetical protein NL676_032784 [Syzygium grande]
MEKGFSSRAEGKKKRRTRLQERAPTSLQLDRIVDGEDAMAGPFKPAVIPLLSPVIICASPLPGTGSEDFPLPRPTNDKDSKRASRGVPASPTRMATPPLRAIFQSRCVL